MLFGPKADEVGPDESGTSRDEKAHKGKTLVGSEVHDVAGRNRAWAARRLNNQLAGIVDLGGRADDRLRRHFDPDPLTQGGAAIPELGRHLAPALR